MKSFVLDLAAQPAFPKGIDADFGGLTLRQYFIGAALTGLCAHKALGLEDEDQIAELAIDQADAVIAALEQEGR